MYRTTGSWRHRELSFKERALLINSLLTSTLWYNVTYPYPPGPLHRLNNQSTVSMSKSLYASFLPNQADLLLKKKHQLEAHG